MRLCRIFLKEKTAYDIGQQIRPALCRRNILPRDRAAAAVVRRGAARISQSAGLSDFRRAIPEEIFLCQPADRQCGATDGVTGCDLTGAGVEARDRWRTAGKNGPPIRR